MRRCLVVCLIACSKTKPAPVPTTRPTPPVAPMESFTLNGYTLTGAEYWPYVGSEDINYPDAVLWGFYPKKGEIGPGETTPNAESASEQALACARTAYDALRAFLQSDPPKLRAIVDKGAAKGYVPRFYLWTNDYTRAATPFPPGVREARLWYWKRKQPEPPKPPGYWKWESVLTQKGECLIPQPAQIEKKLDEELAVAEKP
jgi:hypothetical protein